MGSRRGLAPRSPRGEGAFTLIEMLIVIAIIGILAALITSSVMSARVRAKVTATQSEINSLKTALGTYNSTFGDYPPTTLEPFGLKKLKPTNMGNKAMVACLCTTKKGGPYVSSGEWRESRIVNLDGDDAGSNPTAWWFGDNQLREFTDEWGNPFVYFHHRDYKNPKGLTQYTRGDGGVEECKPQQSTSTKVFHAPDTFMLWSFGPDGKNEDGDDGGSADDVHSW